LAEPHQIPGHQGVPAGHRPVIGFLGPENQGLVILTVEIEAAMFPVLELFTRIPAELLRLGQIRLLQRGSV
jgi:hypothetical protein